MVASQASKVLSYESEIVLFDVRTVWLVDSECALSRWTSILFRLDSHSALSESRNYQLLRGLFVNVGSPAHVERCFNAVPTSVDVGTTLKQRSVTP